ncbi:MAG: autotransporter-associated beta strand repeat-containing protein, partial [Thermoguttaceae bacterium]
MTAANSQAVSLYWDPGLTVTANGGGAGTWDTVTPLKNWYNGTTLVDEAWTAGSDAVFGTPTGGTGGAVTVSTGGAGVSVESLTFSANNYVIGGDKLILTGTSVITASNDVTINSAITDGGAGIGFSKAGGGVLTLTGVNTYAGATTITAGTLSYSNTNQLGNASATNRIVFTGGTLKMTASLTEARGIDINGTCTINPVANAVTLSGGLTGSGALTISGPGPITLVNNTGTDSTYTGTITLAMTAGPGIMPSGGIYDAGLLNFGASTNAILGVGATIATTNGGRATYTRIDNTSGGALTLAGVNLNLIKNSVIFLGTNNLSFGGDLTFYNNANQPTGLQILNNATLSFYRIYNNQNNNHTLDVNGGTIAVGAGGIVLSVSPSAVRGMGFRGSSSLTVAGPIVNGSTSYADTLEWASTGTLTMSGANSYTGWTAIRAGTVILDHTTSDTPKLSSSSPLNMAGSATLELKGGSGNETVSALYLNTTAVGASGRDVSGGTLNIIRDTTPSTSGLINLNTISRYSGGGSGTGTGTALCIGAPNIATTDNSDNSTGIIGAWATVIDGSGNAQWAHSAASASDTLITAYTGYATTWTSTDNTSLASTGTNTLSAATTVNTLRISTGGGSSYNLNLGGYTLTFAGSGLLFAGADDYEIKNGTLNGPAASGSELIVSQFGTGTLTISSLITNNGSNALSLTKTGPGTLVINATNSYTGATYIGNGKVILNTSTTAGTSGPFGTGNGALWVNYGGTLDLNGQTLNAGTVNGSFGKIVNNNSTTPATLIMGMNNANSYNTNICITDGLGAVKLIKTGTGVWDVGAVDSKFSGGLVLDATGTYGGTAASSFNTASTIDLKAIIGNTMLGTGTITLNAGAIWITNINGETCATITNNFIVSSNQYNNFRTESGNAVYLSGSFTGASDAQLYVRGNSGGGAILSGDWSNYKGTLYLASNGGTTAVTLVNTASELANGILNFSATDTTEYDYQSQLQTDATIQIGALTGVATNSIIRNNGLAGTTTTFKIGGLGATSTYAGHINNGSGTTALFKTGAGNLTITGTCTYTGLTTVNNGTLYLNGNIASNSFSVSGGTLDIAATGAFNSTNASATLTGGTFNLRKNATTLNSVSVGNGAIFATPFAADSSNITVGTTTVSTGVNVATGGTLSMVDSKIDTLNLNSLSASTLTVGASTLNFDFNVVGGSLTADLIVLNNNFTVNGATTINVYGSTPGIGGTQYAILQYAVKNGAGSLTLGTTPPVPFGMAAYTLVYDSTHTYLQANGASPPTDAQWKGNLTGAKGSVWNAHDDGVTTGDTNWVDLSGVPITGVLPGSSTHVYISAPSAANFTQTLGGDMTIQALTFNSNPGANVTIGGSGQQLTISGGITIDSGSGTTGHTISTGGLVLTAYQTWYNNSSHAFTVGTSVNPTVISGGSSCELDLMGTGGMFVFNGANTYSGGTYIGPSATLQIGTSTALGTGWVTLDGVLNLHGQNLIVGALTGSGTITNNSDPGSINFSTTNTPDYFNGIIQNGTGTVAIIKSGVGTTSLTNSNTYSGGTTIAGGILNVAYYNPISGVNALGSGTISFTGGTIQYASGYAVDHGSKIKNSTGAISIDVGTQDVSYAGSIDASNISGLTLLSSTGSGTLTLSGANAYTGTNNINGGKLTLGSSTALGDAANVLNLSTSAVLDLNGQSVTQSAVNLVGTTLTNDMITNSATGTTGALNATILNYQGGLTLTSTGSLTFQLIDNGTSVARLLTWNSPATLTLGTTATVGQNRMLQLVVLQGEVDLNMPVVGTSNQICVDRGLTITNGLVKITGASTNQIQDTVVSFGASGTPTLDLNGHSEQINALGDGYSSDASDTAYVQNSAVGTTSTLTLNTTAAGNPFAGVIRDNGGIMAVTKIGTTSPQVFTGVNTYTGPTTISQGTLVLTGFGSIFNSSTISIASGATLDVSGYAPSPSAPYSTGVGQTISGSGSIVGSYTHNQGTIVPGTDGTVGTLTFDNTAAGGTAIISGGNIRIDTSTSSGNDQIVLNGGTGSIIGAVSVNVCTGLGYTVGTPYTIITQTSGSAPSIGGWTTAWDRRGTAPTLSSTATTVQVTLHAATAGDSLNWSGTSGGTWDIFTTQSWYDTTSSSLDTFHRDDNVAFGDTYDGTHAPSTTAVTLNTIV